MQPIGSPSLPPLPNSVAKDLFRPHEPARAGRPDIALDGTEALQALRTQIASVNKEERELAVDILVNLAAGDGDQGKAAQQTLREIYATPGCNDPADNASTRRRIENLSLALCRLALDPSPSKGSKPELFDGKDKLGNDNLSVAVAYLGGRSQEPPGGDNGGAMKAAIELHIDAKLSRLSEGARPVDKEQYLGAGRTTQFAELHAACRGLKSLKVHPEALNLQCSNPGAAQKQFVEPLRAMIAGMKTSGESCRAALIHTGHNEFAHWMTLVAQVEGDDVTFHVLDTDKSACAGRNIPKILGQLLDEADSDATQMIHSSDVQQREVCAQACAVLAYGLLETLDQQMDQGGPVQIGDAITGYAGGLRDLSDDDLGAKVVSTRAHLLDAWAGLEPASPKLEMEHVAAMSGHAYLPCGEPPQDAGQMPVPVDAPADAVLPAGDPTLQIDATFARLAASVRPERLAGGPALRVVDDFQKLSQYVQDCPLSAPCDQNNGAVVAAHAKAMNDPGPVIQQVLNKTPAGLQKFARAIMQQQVLDHRLKNSPLNGITRFAEKSAPMPPNLTQLGFGAVLSQGPTRFHELLSGLSQNADKDVASIAKGRPAKAFEAMAKDVTTYMDNRLRLLAVSVRQLDAILAARPSFYDSLAGKFNGRVSVNDPQVREDAVELRAVLQAQMDALEDPDGAPQALLAFARAAQSDPNGARAVFMSKLRPVVA